jgi:hypothetical protein
MKKSPKPPNPFRWFDSSPEVIRLVVLMYVRYPLSLRKVKDLLFERGIDICHETVRLWWNRFGRCCQTKSREAGFALPLSLFSGSSHRSSVTTQGETRPPGVLNIQPLA